ncbi:MAG TPA: acetyl-CoA carboxylase biotin carboxylase subunit [Flavobacterium sp.]|jgi:acetyl-CoA carboxylase biotin carboxylase subunit|uniref:acetyl-CoA carboxylase biotin carboxylase subunit n=1 Tax=Flavobacterium sp. TaxID=239 RepID=UPI001B790FFF|nr:acetyl-CoA carboxylase biotin carboxylase subunit [Flavobacterium sp.]MBP7182540.1 acetyl-CoA carboxylase biotin carboxylase subunit [Flavobacterium sp.]MBP7318251.1 acetyl-CoA carboxylase biotin carboxylase subunit [Flavobacterium sp.]MBP8886750.1 acetyl-CoA carboxylase biotin carboxylase subunit [Flavobacterium sp.]HRL71487.1 acetyl-CoA carboxylase biotin carboxylase subunit [Flavobacterium sp.]HRM45788.1 acetyl-CoA carboxylase biotin carboxylase subunit [Flavobacterium sp.]
MFKKILIANRGEIALRVIRTCKEMGIKTVAVYSTADAESLHVRFADEAVCIGPPPSNLSYMKMSNVIAAAEITNADAIHPGYGFLSEKAKFSKICQEHGIKFIGPSADMIDRMGDKASAKATMKAAGVPCVPGSEGLLESFEQAQELAAEIGYPIMLKATAGGGGKGMRAVAKEEDLLKAWDDARQESIAAFGNDGMYLEKLIEEPRHIEIQIIGDAYGKACHLSERDCSVQRRHQKLTEETPSPFMTDELRTRMGEAAVKAAEYIKYEGAGTIEFLVDKHRNFYFMEMNTRIQVEHPITEQVIDYDLIREQILVAAGVPISGKNYIPQLHSIECRINAEDPYNDFRPSPGKITTLHMPGGHGVRLDTHVYSGYTIPPNYDSLIAKLITTAQSREEAISKMKRALDEFVIEGIKTTIPFHRQLMEDPRYIAGDYTTAFMDTFKMNDPE